MMNMYPEREGEWRVELWEYMLNHMPVSIVMNLNVGYFRVRDNSDTYIYADDLDAQIYDEIVEEWGRLLEPKSGASFYDEFSLAQVKRQRKQGRKKIKKTVYRVIGNRVIGVLDVRLLFQRINHEQEMEFQFEDKLV